MRGNLAMATVLVPAFIAGQVVVGLFVSPNWELCFGLCLGAYTLAIADGVARLRTKRTIVTERLLGGEMDGFLIELLSPVGWQRENELLWRFADAEAYGRAKLSDASARAFRVLHVKVSEHAVLAVERPRCSEHHDADTST